MISLGKPCEGWKVAWWLSVTGQAITEVMDKHAAEIPISTTAQRKSC